VAAPDKFSIHGPKLETRRKNSQAFVGRGWSMISCVGRSAYGGANIGKERNIGSPSNHSLSLRIYLVKISERL
jgi:hypothetical protein